MALTRAEVEHVARLAHLGLTDEDAEKFRSQLSQILEYFEVLRRVDTVDVPPTSHTLPLENVLRLDAPRPSWPRDEILANAPREEAGYIRVRKVLE